FRAASLGSLLAAASPVTRSAGSAPGGLYKGGSRRVQFHRSTLDGAVPAGAHAPLAAPRAGREATACPACGGAPALLYDAAALRALAAQARRFHAARLRSQRREELEERASFTQDDDASLFACDACGLLVRAPRPTDAAMTRTYADDRYPEDR